MKKFLIVLLSVFLLSAIVGCSNQPADNSNQGENPTEEPAEESAPEMITIRGVYYGLLSTDHDKYYDSIRGMTDCVVVFDFNNDDTNREMPSTQYANSTAISLSINSSNTYDAYKSTVAFAENLERFSEIKQVLGYGKILGGSDPVTMYALFFINPNDFKSSESIVLNIDGMTGTCSPDLAKEIKYANTVIEEIDGLENEQISEFLWRCDTAYKNIEKTAKYAAQNPGSDYKLVSDAMLALFSSSYGVNLNERVSWGGDNNLRRSSALIEELSGFDKDALVAACPEISDSINGLIDASDKYAQAIINTSTSVNSLAEIADAFETHYYKIIKYFSLSKAE